jgi:DNA mismatch repair protein MutS
MDGLLFDLPETRKQNEESGPVETPLMKQYNAIKAKYPGALLLFRVGDFYETFGADAVIASKVLDIVLTRRANGAASEIELAGFPHHALEAYLPRLVRAGHRVAICDQLEDPKFAKGVVKRGVTELVTPGVAFNDNVLERGRSNFLASYYPGTGATGIAFLDISTGEFLTTQGTEDHVRKLVQGFAPSEIIYPKFARERGESLVGEGYAHFAVDDWAFSYEFGYERLTAQFRTPTLKGFGIENLKEAIAAAGAILHYLELTEHREKGHLATISRIEEEHYVWLDPFTIRNLELVSAQHEGGVSLLQVLDRTVTPMGTRLLHKWMVLPLKEQQRIEERLHIVELLAGDPELSEALVDLLRTVADLERLIGKVAAGRINPRELVQLKRSLTVIRPVQESLARSSAPALLKIAGQLDACEFMVEKLKKELKDDVSIVSNQGGLICDGIHAELDELRKIAYSGKEYLVQIQKREIARTGISSLKVSYNKVFGYYLEVSNANKDKVPSDWIRKQTLVNAERYITEELKTYEEKILHAEEKIIALEQKLFQELVLHTAGFTPQIQLNARVLAALDCLLSFAQVARTNRYTRPSIHAGLALDIRAGRHPVIERQLPVGDTYIPNDVYLDNDSQQIIIITGPNMSGKSALLRQTALIVLMAQIGCFVPAESAAIGLVDKVFTRVGASDNLSRGESTFMVEMIETASILNNLSERSLILMDEIGRGTSTYDGVSIAWAIVEYLHDHTDCRPKTLFATHYHELNQLAEDHSRVKNFNVSVREVGDKIIFLRKLKEGGSEHSFGIHVAQMAGMPNKIVLRAADILKFLEKERHKNEPVKKPKKAVPADSGAESAGLKALRELLAKVDINAISPIEALLKLNEVMRLLKK